MSNKLELPDQSAKPGMSSSPITGLNIPGAMDHVGILI
ncbi:hypothetical protein NCHU2750_48030 (plasmid) [Neorhizobium sp. NCHU2750]|nr:hypothetical protein NCHU2750_48030 [Neorhizobium sp. NCHU2750]